jgi:ribulose 1,5-bisphosphate synthetase/thiazole synthase
MRGLSGVMLRWMLRMTVIVGGGTSGLTVADRLTENPHSVPHRPTTFKPTSES